MEAPLQDLNLLVTNGTFTSKLVDNEVTLMMMTLIFFFFFFFFFSFLDGDFPSSTGLDFLDYLLTLMTSTLWPLSFWNWLFRLWIWKSQLLQEGMSVRNQYRMSNRVDQDETVRNEPSHHDLHCRQMYLFLFCRTERVNTRNNLV